MTQLTSSPPARSRSLLGLRGLRRFNEVSGYSVLMVLAALFMIPLYWMFSTAVKSPSRLSPSRRSGSAPAQWSNFREVFQEVPFGRFYLNTLFLAGANIVGHLVSVTLVAYGFARLRFPGRNFLFLVMLSTLMIPYQVTLVPRFVMFAKLGMINSYWPLILPAFTGTPFLIFLVRQYMMSIPFDLDEAAYIDGATRFDVFWRIIIPLARPALMLVVVFTFIDVWNDFLQPLIYLNDPQMFTVSLGLSFFRARARPTGTC